MRFDNKRRCFRKAYTQTNRVHVVNAEPFLRKLFSYHHKKVDEWRWLLNKVWILSVKASDKEIGGSGIGSKKLNQVGRYFLREEVVKFGGTKHIIRPITSQCHWGIYWFSFLGNVDIKYDIIIRWIFKCIICCFLLIVIH